MERSDIISELKVLYQQIPTHKMEIFKEFLLIINLKNISGNSIREDWMEEIFTNYSGASTLYNWTDLKDNIISYLHAHPEEKHFNYAIDILKYTKLRDAVATFHHKEIMFLFNQKTGLTLLDLDTVSVFLSYHLFTYDNFIYRTCYNTTRDLLRECATLYRPPTILSKYYILDRILSNKKYYTNNSLWFLKNDLVPAIMSEKSFLDQFLLVNKMDFYQCLN